MPDREESVRLQESTEVVGGISERNVHIKKGRKLKKNAISKDALRKRRRRMDLDYLNKEREADRKRNRKILQTESMEAKNARNKKRR